MPRFEVTADGQRITYTLPDDAPYSVWCQAAVAWVCLNNPKNLRSNEPAMRGSKR
jgi:hypothetical protein